MKQVIKSAVTVGEDLDARFDDIERRLERLRGLYESFFMGVERTPPAVPRRELNRLFVEMQQETIKNATQRFRFNSLSQRWVLLTTYWNRTLREIEAGTYRRDIEKAQRRMAKTGGDISAQDAIAMGIPAGRVKAFLGRQQHLRARQQSVSTSEGSSIPATVTASASVPTAASLSPTVPSAAASAPAATASAALVGVTDDEARDFFRRYVDAHKEIGAPAVAVTFDQMRQRLAREVPKILLDKGCSRVSLDVVVTDGKVRLRAKPIKS